MAWSTKVNHILMRHPCGLLPPRRGQANYNNKAKGPRKCSVISVQDLPGRTTLKETTLPCLHRFLSMPFVAICSLRFLSFLFVWACHLLLTLLTIIKHTLTLQILTLTWSTHWDCNLSNAVINFILTRCGCWYYLESILLALYSRIIHAVFTAYRLWMAVSM